MKTILEYIKKTKTSRYDELEMGTTFDDILEYLKQTFGITSVPHLKSQNLSLRDAPRNKNGYRMFIIPVMNNDTIYLQTPYHDTYSFGFSRDKRILNHVFLVSENGGTQTDEQAIRTLKKIIANL